jgi:predicted NBD/HSP70 family sugar kinase
MSQEVVALGDIGASQTRLVLKDLSGETVGELFEPTDPSNYETSVNKWADSWRAMAGERQIIGAALAIAAAVEPETGELIQAGDLTPWLGQWPGHDLGHLLDITVGVRNDVEAIAASQQHVNAENGYLIAGVATTLSSGWGAALYDGESYIKSDEPGHEDLRLGATCTCKGEGHAEAWISGNGKLLNTGLEMPEWLKIPGNSDLLAADISIAVIGALLRYEKRDGFWPDEIRWTGGVALNQPFIMQDAGARVRHELGPRAPAFDTATYGGQAGIHGTFVHALELAKAA